MVYGDGIQPVLQQHILLTQLLQPPEQSQVERYSHEIWDGERRGKQLQRLLSLQALKAELCPGWGLLLGDGDWGPFIKLSCVQLQKARLCWWWQRYQEKFILIYEVLLGLEIQNWDQTSVSPWRKPHKQTELLVLNIHGSCWEHQEQKRCSGETSAPAREREYTSNILPSERKPTPLSTSKLQSGPWDTSTTWPKPVSQGQASASPG